MAQYSTPQFIESEGKMVSFLTFRQFFLLTGGGALIAIFFYTLPFYLFAVFSIIVGIVIGSIAFLKIDDLTIPTYIRHAIGFSFASKKYIWAKKETVYPFKIRKQDVQENSLGKEVLGLQGKKQMVELRRK